MFPDLATATNTPEPVDEEEEEESSEESSEDEVLEEELEETFEELSIHEETITVMLNNGNNQYNILFILFF